MNEVYLAVRILTACAAIVFVLTFPVLAQSPPAPSQEPPAPPHLAPHVAPLAVPPPPVPQFVTPSTFTLNVTPAELDVIGAGLQDQPFKVAAPLLQKLRNEVEPQMRPAAAAASPDKKP